MTTQKPKLTIVPPDPVGAQALFMEIARGIVEDGLTSNETAELLKAIPIEEYPDIHADMARVEELKAKLQKALDARADDQAR
jgi:hypothetical protein